MPSNFLEATYSTSYMLVNTGFMAFSKAKSGYADEGFTFWDLLIEVNKFYQSK